MIPKLDDPSYEKRLAHILSHPDLLMEICAHVANGGTVLSLVEVWDIRYSDVTEWLHVDPARDKAYIKALNDRGEWGNEVYLSELRGRARLNLAAAFNEDGALKPIQEIPPEIMREIESIEVDELFEGTGQDRVQIGVTKKVKLNSKHKAIELAMKNAGLLVDKVQHSVDKKLEDLLAEANKKAESTKKEETPVIAPTPTTHGEE